VRAGQAAGPRAGAIDRISPRRRVQVADLPLLARHAVPTSVSLASRSWCVLAVSAALVEIQPLTSLRRSPAAQGQNLILNMADKGASCVSPSRTSTRTY